MDEPVFAPQRPLPCELVNAVLKAPCGVRVTDVIGALVVAPDVALWRTRVSKAEGSARTGAELRTDSSPQRSGGTPSASSGSGTGKTTKSVPASRTWGASAGTSSLPPQMGQVLSVSKGVCSTWNKGVGQRPR